MKWYRFLGQQEQIRYGCDLAADNSIQLLQGDPFNALTGPLGPALLTPDDVPGPQRHRLSCTVWT